MDLDTRVPVWLYRVQGHKTQHHNRTRVVAVGPRAQAVLKEFLKCCHPEDRIWSPMRAMADRAVIRRANRKTKVQPSQQNRRVQKRKRPPSSFYKTTAYSHAIRLACLRAGITVWAPNQLRHLHGTKVRKQFGLEAAQVALGHAQANITEIYAERNTELAVRVAEAIG
jgi:integrase